MAAVSKGYLLTADDGKTLMTIVKTCLEAKGRYNLHATTATTTEDSTDCVSLAFTLRIAFGGMSCDMAFLERLRQRWCVKELPCTSVISSSCGVEETETFTPSKHLLLEAMDFHCFKHMLRECGNVSKEVVWWHSSSINIRPVIGLGAEEQIATETKRREETSWEYTAYAALIHAFQSKKIAEFAGKVVTPAFKQGTLTNWFAKMTDPCC